MFFKSHYKTLILKFLLPFIIASLLAILYKKDSENVVSCFNRYFSANRSFSLNASKLFSSVICRGSNHTDRFCKFKNLCFLPDSKSFIFFHSASSIVYGVPLDRYSPALADFSSVFDHNILYFNYIDLIDTAASKFNITLLNGHYLTLKRFNPENLMHVFHDDILPAFITLQETSYFDEEENKDFYLAFADDRQPGPYKELYDDFLFTKPLYLNLLSNGSLYCLQNMYVGLNKYSTWYNYGFKEPQKPIYQNLNKVFPAIEHFRAYFIRKFSLHDASTNSAVLLTRSLNRKIINENEIVEEIKSVTHLEVSVLNLENYPVIKAIELILQSKLVIGMHGSLLILSLFLSSNSILIELFPYGVNPELSTPYKTLAFILNVVYFSWENKIKENSIPHPEYSPDLGGILHLPKEKQVQIEGSIVSPFICCYDPVWLYRIYQDTIIDVKSFHNVLTDAWKKHSTILNNTRSYYLYPSEVQNISCTTSENGSLTIIWAEPWNINYLQVSLVEYELWVQAINSDDVKAYIMKKNKFVMFVENISVEYYLWVRCHADDRKGPFNSSPLIC